MATGVLHWVALALAMVTGTQLDLRMLVAAAGFGLAFGAAGFAKSTPRWAIQLLLGMHLVEVVLCIVLIGWSPAAILFFLFTSVVFAVRFGWRGTYVVPLLLWASLWVGGWLIQAGHYEPVLLPDTSSQAVWTRVAILHAAITAGIAWTVRRLLQFIAETELNARAVRDGTQREVRRYEETRRSREEVQRSLLDSQRLHALSQMSSGLAHQVNNTFTVVQAARERLEGSLSPSEVRGLAAGVEQTARRCADSIQEILAFSRRESSNRHRVSVGEELSACESMLRQAVPHDILLKFDVAQGPSILADPLRLRQVVVNLVLNARAAVGSGGTITVRAHQASEATCAKHDLGAGSWLVLSVRDTGHGMAESERAQAVEPFVSFDATGHREGLGLTVVNDFAQALGGRLMLESELGSGTTASIFLPVATSPDSGRGPESGDAATGAGQSVLESWSERVWLRQSFSSVAKDVALVLWLMLFVQLSLSSVSDTLALMVQISSATLCSLLFWWQRPPLMARALGLMLLAFLASGIAILHAGFMASAAVMGLIFVVLVAVIYTNWWVTAGALLCTTLVYISAPTLHEWMPLMDKNVTPGSAANWFRLGVTAPLVLHLSTRLVMHVMEAAVSQLNRVQEATSRLQEVIERRVDETAALGEAQRSMERMTRVEATGRAVSVIAHDLNNALAGVMGWSSILASSETIDPEDLQSAIQCFDVSAEMAGSLSEVLRPMKSVDSGASKFTDIAIEVTALANTLRALVPAQHELDFDVVERAPISISLVAFHRILQNLVRNGVAAMPEAGVLRVRVGRSEATHEVYLTVSDTGIGIEPMHLAQVFDPYFTTKPAGQGTGLGLYSVKRMVESTGGRVHLQSERGRGTEVTLTWPEATALQTPIGEEPARTEAKGSQEPILVAEDEPLVRKALVAGLRRAGYRALEACDGTEAIQLMRTRNDWAALCTDAVMPGRSIINVCELFRQRQPFTPILLVSGYVPEQLAVVQQAQDVRYVPKPVSPSELARILADEIARTRSASGV